MTDDKTDDAPTTQNTLLEYEAFVALARTRGVLDGMIAKCAELHISLEYVFGPSKTKSVVYARRHLWRWLADELHWSAHEIGTLFGRNSSGGTVAYQIETARIEASRR